MDQHIYPDVSKDSAQKRRELAPEIYGAFRTFSASLQMEPCPQRPRSSLRSRWRM
jgi:hypothetical protein